jgi:hypothetical protein
MFQCRLPDEFDMLALIQEFASGIAGASRVRGPRGNAILDRSPLARGLSMKRALPMFVAILSSAICCLTQSLGQENTQQNPGDLDRIIRVKPSAIASKIGQGVEWETDWQAALEKSQSSGKPIFWYIASVPGTFMDRKVEIDRYMLAGPFSWPPIVRRLNEEFVAIRIRPNKELAERFELKPYQFVEPGFLVLDAAQKVRLRVDHLTTLHPLWLDHVMGGASDSKTPPSTADRDPNRTELDKAWAEFASDSPPNSIALPAADDALAAEKYLLAGMIAFRRGAHDEAKELWVEATRVQPDSPVAWKAAAEAEGFGPFVRGFEVFCPLPQKAFAAGIDSVGSAAPNGIYSAAELWPRGVDFLLGMQASNGGFFDSDYDFGGADSLPNVHVAVSSLVGMALLKSLDRVDAARAGRVRDAIDRAAKFVSDDANINVRDKDEILWAQAYRTRFLASLVQANFGDVAAHRANLNRVVKGLEQIQLPTGGWYHEYANPFVTGTALTALHQADQAGATIDSQKVERGLASLAGDRLDAGAYPYASRSGGKAPRKTSIEASAGRIPICDMALWMWKKLDDRQLEKSARVALDNHKFLSVAYKYDNHTSTMAYGGFFFWYDMHARAELIARIADEATRNGLAEEHRKLILALPEIDGCFVDSHELGRCYGTAMALLSLAELQ